MRCPLQERLILAIETASPAGGVAIVGKTVYAEVFLATSLTHSRRLLTAVDYLLHHLELDLEDLSGVAVSIGPGSFTGLRIGLATAKGLALATGLPLVGIETLKALAAQAPFFPGLICPCLDARRRQVYTAIYRWEGKRLEEILAPALMAPEKLLTHLKGKVLFLGDALKAYGKLWAQALGEDFETAPAQSLWPRAATVGLLGRAKILAGQEDDPHRLVPLYLRPSEAELKFREKG